jgi:hypothetical protein
MGETASMCGKMSIHAGADQAEKLCLHKVGSYIELPYSRTTELFPAPPPGISCLSDLNSKSSMGWNKDFAGSANSSPAFDEALAFGQGVCRLLQY